MDEVQLPGDGDDDGGLVEGAGAARTTRHLYISTACQHGLHQGRCRRECKFCDAPCLCLCHPRDER